MKIVATFPVPFQNYVQELADILLKAGHTVDFRFFDSPPPLEDLLSFVKKSSIYVSGSNEKRRENALKAAFEIFPPGFNEIGDVFVEVLAQAIQGDITIDEALSTLQSKADETLR